MSTARLLTSGLQLRLPTARTALGSFARSRRLSARGAMAALAGSQQVTQFIEGINQEYEKVRGQWGQYIGSEIKGGPCFLCYFSVLSCEVEGAAPVRRGREEAAFSRFPRPSCVFLAASIPARSLFFIWRLACLGKGQGGGRGVSGLSH